ncbi:hypothetical protein, partial [Streptosporangium carneum]|uniref:hypothetical protein n=1 Tax=Streptosporangium carneum TaxID=47481 RepID=UPI0031E5EA48
MVPYAGRSLVRYAVPAAVVLPADSRSRLFEAPLRPREDAGSGIRDGGRTRRPHTTAAHDGR